MLGAIGAVTTVWVSAAGLNGVVTGDVSAAINDDTTSQPSESESESSAGSETENAESGDASKSQNGNGPPEKNLLTFSVILGSIVSGWFGARMRSSRLNQLLLQNALAETARRESAAPELEPLIRSAPSAAEAARLATGKEVVGAFPQRHHQVGVGARDLPKLLNVSLVQEKLGEQSLRGNEHLLQLHMLATMETMQQGIVDVLGDIKITDAAMMSLEQFMGFAKENGIRDGLDKPLRKIHEASVAVVQQIKAAPQPGRLPA